jgi:hypothetical protein
LNDQRQQLKIFIKIFFTGLELDQLEQRKSFNPAFLLRGYKEIYFPATLSSTATLL